MHGANIALASRKREVIDNACLELNKLGITALGMTLDVRDEVSCKNVVDQTVKRFGAIDVLVNNAAGNFMTSIETLSLNGFKTVLDIDLLGCFNMSKAVLESMKVAHSGLIVNISATLHYRATPFQMHASAAKAAIDSFTNNVGIEWAEYGIRCVSVAPGPIEGTAGGPEGRVFGQKRSTLSPEMIMPLGKFGTVEDIANTVLFVASDAGSHINATTIVVDGGSWHGVTAQFHMMKKAIAEKSAAEKQNFKGGISKAKL